MYSAPRHGHRHSRPHVAVRAVGPAGRASDAVMLGRDAQRYYGQSENELAQRYVKSEPFLSASYCAAALEHRYSVYPFIREFADFSAWAGKRVLEVGCGQGADLSQFALGGASTFGCDLTFKHCDVSRKFAA